MRLIPVALALFHRRSPAGLLEVWVQRREDDGPYHGLLEFPGGGIEPGEEPVEAAVREVEEEVGILIQKASATFMGLYPTEHPERTVLLYVFLFPDPGQELRLKGKWLPVDGSRLSGPYLGLIPGPNHRIIDDLYHSLYDGPDE
ncbi:MAG TPA: NUDIX domain-containing protein [Bacteriovoracaceae bacterium]|nr:NUDIX domain-containing protein [Bacteriovoracaceae bacterium]